MHRLRTRPGRGAARWARGQGHPGRSARRGANLSRAGHRIRRRAMTAWLTQDYEARGEQDADRVTASPAELAGEYDKGAETAYQLTTLAAANGRTADYIEGRQEELTGPEEGQDQWTPAEQEWAQGYRHGAESALALLRQLEAADTASAADAAGPSANWRRDDARGEQEAGAMRPVGKERVTSRKPG